MDVALETLDLLGEGRVFQAKERSFGEFRRQSQLGLPIESFDLVAKHIPGSQRAHWEGIVHRDSAGARMSERDSATVVRLAYILALSKSVWGTWKQAQEFLTRSNNALDGQSPLQASESEWGAREVERLLNNIRFGLPA